MKSEILAAFFILLSVSACDPQTITMSDFERYVFESCRSDGGTEEQCLCQSARFDEELSASEKKYFPEFLEGNIFVADKVNAGKVLAIGMQCM